MKDKIKFRAWDYLTSPPSMIYFDLYDVPLHPASCDVEIMQYTGLKDKNGKDVYEGDIINVFDWGTIKSLIGIAKIQWCRDDNGWRHFPSYDIETYDLFRNVEIIGNIYENPELLEES